MMVGMKFFGHFSPWRTDHRPCWYCVHFDGMLVVEALRGVRPVGQPSYGPYRRMDAASGSVSLGLMMSLDHQGYYFEDSEMHKAKDQRLLCKAALMVAFATYMSSATAQTTTFGSPDCGQWVAEKASHRRGWLMGYLSGMNVIHNATNGTPRNPLAALSSPDQAYLWMDNWCKANPLKQVSEGGMELFVELMGKKK